MSLFEAAPDFEKIALKLIAHVEQVDHVDADEILFLRELDTKPPSAAKIYRIGDHPMGFFTDKKYCIVVFWAVCDYMTPEQLAILVLHEMLHIPSHGAKLVDHDVQDFRSILGLDLDWQEPGREVPDLLGKKGGRTGKKRVNVCTNKSRAKITRSAIKSSTSNDACGGNLEDSKNQSKDVLRSV